MGLKTHTENCLNWTCNEQQNMEKTEEQSWDCQEGGRKKMDHFGHIMRYPEKLGEKFKNLLRHYDYRTI